VTGSLVDVGLGLTFLGAGIALAGWFIAHGLDSLGNHIRSLKP
jgi:hypothetical protein